MRRSPTLFVAGALVAGALAAAPAQAATITVTSTADSGAGSLRATVAAATAADIVVVPAGTYALATPVVIDKTLTLRGAGARGTILDGGGATRVLQLQAPAGQVTIDGITVTRGKVTGDGAGIDSSVPLVLRDSALVGNQAVGGSGGGLWQAAVLTMERTLVAGNTAARGGGIELRPAGAPTSTITSSTIAQNAGDDTGGGIDVSNSSAQFLNISNSTIDANTLSSAGGQGGNFRAWSSTTVRLRNTWTGHGIATSGPNCYQGGGAFVISQGHNAQDINDAECHFDAMTGDKVNADAKFTALQDNGGPTDTYGLLAGSALLDAGDGAACAALDQREVARPQGAGCDIGAVERTITPTLGAPAAEAIAATTATITASVNPMGLSGTLRVDYGVSTAYGSSASAPVAASASAATVGVALSGLAASTTYHYRATLTTPDGEVTSADGTFSTVAPAPPTGGGTPPPAGGGTTPPPSGGGTTVKCTVPKLKGLRLAKARAKLAKAHCRLGKVKKPKGRAGRGLLVVRAQSPKAGTKLAANAKVRVTLGKPAKPKKAKPKR